jgi:NAD(P)-dependent dehydrogenase (short-subunit alcohol dehydrogenase family)
MSTVVVGGGSGIGGAVVKRLRGAGQEVLVWHLVGGDITCDISDPDSVVAAMEQTLASDGAPDRFVTCAGVVPRDCCWSRPPSTGGWSST